MKEKIGKSSVKYALMFCIVLAGCGSDLYSKKMVVEKMSGKSPVSLVSGFLELEYRENDKAAFSMLDNIGPELRRPLLIGLQLTGSVVLCCLVFFWRRQSFLVLAPYLIIISGALGNALNRIYSGHVVDFIHFHVRDSFSWPVFNVADILISVGAGLVLLQLIFLDSKKRKLVGC